MIARRTFNTVLLATFVGVFAAVPVHAQTQEEGGPTARTEQAPDRDRQPVTVRVRNDSWSDMRIYVMDAATQSRPRRLGTVTALTTRSFEVPDHLGAGQGTLVLVAVAVGSRERQFTRGLQTWPGSRVDWNIAASLGLSFATVYHVKVSP